jgi:glyoxylase-like metal-dependent hydrolase (beta-lactamase superfamily II)
VVDGSHTTSEWHYGDITLKRVTELVAPTPTDDVLEVGADAPATIELSIHSFVLRAHGATILVDTCIGNCRQIPGLPDLTLHTPFLAALEAAGASRDDVDVVINTHLHFDHVGWNTMLVDGEWVPTFPNARHYVGADELRYWNGVEPGARGPYGASVDDAIAPLQTAGLLTLFECGDALPGGLVALATPGHTPGHVSILCPTGSDTLVITGDVLHHAWQFSTPDTTCRVDVDAAAAARTRRRFAQRCVDERLIVCGTHFADAPLGTVQALGPGAYTFTPIQGEHHPAR